MADLDHSARVGLDSILGTPAQDAVHAAFVAWVTDPTTTLRDAMRAGIMVRYRPDVPAYPAGEFTLIEPRSRSGVTITSADDGTGWGVYRLVGSGAEVSVGLEALLSVLPAYTWAHSMPFVGGGLWCSEAHCASVIGWAHRTPPEYLTPPEREQLRDPWNA